MNASVSHKFPRSAFAPPQDSSSLRLRQLSEEVSRIAAALAHFSNIPQEEQVQEPVVLTGESPHVPLSLIRQVIRARRMRARFFNEKLFSDPAWDIILDLLEAEITQRRVPVSSLCIAAAVPPTTALRWIRSMTDAGLLQRRPDPHDGRRDFVELSPAASELARRYFNEISKVAVV